MNPMLVVLALMPFAGTLLLAALPNDRRRLCAWLAGAFPLAGLALVVMQAPTIMTGEVLRWSADWVLRNWAFILSRRISDRCRSMRLPRRSIGSSFPPLRLFKATRSGSGRPT